MRSVIQFFARMSGRWGEVGRRMHPPYSVTQVHERKPRLADGLQWVITRTRQWRFVRLGAVAWAHGLMHNVFEPMLVAFHLSLE